MGASGRARRASHASPAKRRRIGPKSRPLEGSGLQRGEGGSAGRGARGGACASRARASLTASGRPLNSCWLRRRMASSASARSRNSTKGTARRCRCRGPWVCEGHEGAQGGEVRPQLCLGHLIREIANKQADSHAVLPWVRGVVTPTRGGAVSMPCGAATQTAARGAWRPGGHSCC